MSNMQNTCFAESVKEAKDEDCLPPISFSDAIREVFVDDPYYSGIVAPFIEELRIKEYEERYRYGISN